MWRTEAVSKHRMTFGVELLLNRGFMYRLPQSYVLLLRYERS
jgi:hypothetical protein